jgi:hypothetical protein
MCYISKDSVGQAWWYMLIIPVLRRQEDLGQPGLHSKTVSKKQNKTKKPNMV